MSPQDPVAEAIAQERPGAHVLRLFLDPADGHVRRIIFQLRFDQGGGQGVELFEADDVNIVATKPGSVLP